MLEINKYQSEHYYVIIKSRKPLQQKTTSEVQIAKKDCIVNICAVSH